ncbi:MAG: hypothetical protein J3R72DRAFT_123471 [Linnemannia gamsii]|nr:MAG: hypothetical protein J3R72DRAFT_123471 [Linnemannia gamsii]
MPIQPTTSVIFVIFIALPPLLLYFLRSSLFLSSFFLTHLAATAIAGGGTVPFLSFSLALSLSLCALHAYLTSTREPWAIYCFAFIMFLALS